MFGLAVAAPGLANQLPPQVLFDQLLLRTERLVDADDLDAAVEAMEEAVALAKEHELELAPGLRFEHARMAVTVGLLGAAKKSVTGYLMAAGREAESYRDAVTLLEDVERILERRDAPACSPEPTESACWMELVSHPACYVWNPNPQPEETATWTGECSAGLAVGPGALTWTTPEGSQDYEGAFRFGRFHGESVVRDSEGWVDEGPYRFGKRHGAWIEKTAEGAVLEGPYVDGEENGHWILKFADAGVEEGPFVDGRRHGHWVLRFASGNIAEGSYADGERNGHWVWTYPDGQVESGPYVGGKQHGYWVIEPPEGGRWEGRYTDGEKNGHWVERFANGNVAEGPYSDDKRHGDWTWTFPSGQVESGPYVAGERHGRWVVRPAVGDIFYVTFVRGVRQ